SWMRSASGNKASRVRMGLLVDRSNSFAGGGNGLANPLGSGAAQNIVDGEDVFEFHEIVEFAIEMRVDGLELLEREVLKFTMLVERKPLRLSHLLMRDAERVSLADQVRGGGECVHVAGFGRRLHTLAVKFRALHPSRDQGKHGNHGFGGVKQRLLGLLQIL